MNSRVAAALPFAAIAFAHILSSLVFFWGGSGWNFAPTDDGWLELVYARNFADGLIFAYNPATAESGMISPLWVMTLGILHNSFLVSNLDLPALAQLLSIGFAMLVSVFAYLIVRRLTQHSWIALLAGLAIAIDPTFSFARVSGAEVALFSALTLGTVWALLARKQTSASLLLGLAVLARFDGIILVALVALAWIGLRVWEHDSDEILNFNDIQEFALLIAPAAFMIAGWVLYNWSVTGMPWPNFYYVNDGLNGLSNGDNFAAVWTGYLQHTSYLASLQAIVTMAVASTGAYYAVKQGGAAGVILGLFPLLIIYAYLALIVPLPDERWTFTLRRYLDPVLPYFVILFALGIAMITRAMSEYIASQRRLDLELRSSLRSTFGAIVVILVIVPLAGVPFKWNTLVSEHSSSVQNISDSALPAAEWIEHNVPPASTIAVTEPGALRYFTDRSLIDLTGMSLHEGIGEDAFSLARRIRPDYVVTFDDIYSRSWPFGNEATRIGIANNAILPSPRLIVYKTDYDIDLTPNDMPLNVSLAGLRLIDSIDVGNRDDEQSHDWEMKPLNATVSRTFRANFKDAIIDDARVTTGVESFRVATVPGEELTIVKRYDAGVRGEARVLVDGEEVGIWSLPSADYFFGEDLFTIPASFVTGDSINIRLEHVPDPEAPTSLNSFHYWFYVSTNSE